MADALNPPISTMAIEVANSSELVAIYEYDDVIIFLKPGARLRGVFTGSDKAPKSTGTMTEWPDLTPASGR